MSAVLEQIQTAEMVTEDEPMGSISFLNRVGDITIVWDETNRDKILEMVRKKMNEGYHFFTTKKFMFKRFTRKVKVSKSNLYTIEEIIITDEQFEKMCKDMDDKDIAALVRDNSVGIVQRKSKSKLDTIKRANTAEEVVKGHSLAVRPIAGG